jgi:hypothetical protein
MAEGKTGGEGRASRKQNFSIHEGFSESIYECITVTVI